MTSQLKASQAIQRIRFKFKQNQIENRSTSDVEISNKTTESFRDELSNTHFSHDRRRKRTSKSDVDEKFEVLISFSIRNVSLSNVKQTFDV